MTHLNSETVHCHLGWCLIAVVTDASENIRPERSLITHSEKLSWPAVSRQTSRPGDNMGTKEGVHNVHTLGFGSGRTGIGLGRIAEDFGGVAEIQVLEPGSSPTSGTCFPRSEGFFVFLRVHNVHTLASDLMFQVCGVPEAAYSVVWGSGCLRGTGYRPAGPLLGVHPRSSFRRVFAFTNSLRPGPRTT